ncbi:MAG: DEAD/DEAH box helicase [Patescibacteria group bacterium]|nr:DEAD/DEAH box helicase [Patescibacteria group bacterium]
MQPSHYKSSRPPRRESTHAPANHSSQNRGGSRGSFRSAGSGSRAGFRGGYRGSQPNRSFKKGGRGNFAQHINESKFINKAVITESAPHFVPEHAFADFVIDERLKVNIAKKGYVTPTPIQDKAIPHILRGADLVGIANTGTGKTAAFLIPLINKILKDPRARVLIVVPTRELALQIETEFQGFSRMLGIWSVSCVGGANIGAQIRALSRLSQVVIGTPGRLCDLIKSGHIRLAEYGTLVLDEADRMLDMGFIADIRFMVSKMPAMRETLFFSATMSPEIQKLIKEFLREPVMISVKTGDTAQSIDQDVVRVPRDANKFDILTNLLRQPGFDKVLVFGRTKHGVQRLAESLVKAGFVAEAIHGNKSQSQRVKALRLFKEHHAKILVATDVAARGLDVSGISHVINYDLPATYEDYVHRIGRTGRGGKKGVALTFIG